MAPVDRPAATLRQCLERGRKAFNRGDYFEAHEHWEEVWRTLRGDERLLVHGLIQLAAGLHHLQEGRPRPAGRLLVKSLEKLSRCAPALRQQLRVEALVGAVEHLLTEVGGPLGSSLRSSLSSSPRRGARGASRA